MGLAFPLKKVHICLTYFLEGGLPMKPLRGLHIEDCYLTFRLVQQLLRPDAHTEVADCRPAFLDRARHGRNDFLILDGNLPDWPIAQYAEDLSHLPKVPFFLYSSNAPETLGPLLELKPKIILPKDRGPHGLREAILFYFYGLDSLRFCGEPPKTLSMS
jgi:hypothetical protein